MPTPLSMDLRIRVLAWVAQGLSHRQVGERFAFQEPSSVTRSGGLDVVRRLQDRIGKLIGSIDSSREHLWFERSGEGQVDVIRWVKEKVEKPGTRHAYLVDPYLGTPGRRSRCMRARATHAIR
jgi:hypothetical protein